MMIGRRTITGLSLLSALLFCAIAAEGSAAAEAKNTTVFTCVKGGGKLDFKDAHCDETTTAGKGEFGHEGIVSNKETEIHVTNEKTKEKTTQSTPAVFKSTLFGLTLEIEATEVATDTSNKSFIESLEFASEHKVKGTAAIIFNNPVVKKPTNCVVKPITVSTKFKGVEGLGAGGNEMGLEFEADVGGVFSEFTIEDNGTGKCALKNVVIQVVGTAIATGTPAATARESGTTLNFSAANEMQSLEIKGAKKPAEFSASLTANMVKSEVVESPIALTTTT